MTQLVYNAIKTPDGTLLESLHRHDYKTYQDKISNEVYMVDGGLDYLRRNVNKVPYEELSLSTDSPYEEIRKVLVWGTYGRAGSDPLKYLILCDMETDHIKAVLEMCKLVPWRRELFEKELEFRND